MRAQSTPFPTSHDQEPLLNRIFLEHPRSLGESYWEHQRHALQFGTVMIVAGIACLIHALIPALFERTGSTMISRLYHRLVATRRLRGIARDRSGPVGAFSQL